MLIPPATSTAQGAQGEAWRQGFADRAGRVVGLAAETFNDGLRAYYFAFAAIMASPEATDTSSPPPEILSAPKRRAKMSRTAGIRSREFHSEVLEVLNA